MNRAGIILFQNLSAEFRTEFRMSLTTLLRGVPAPVVTGTAGGVTAALSGNSGCGVFALGSGVRLRAGGVLGDFGGAAYARPGRIVMDKACVLGCGVGVGEQSGSRCSWSG